MKPLKYVYEVTRTVPTKEGDGSEVIHVIASNLTEAIKKATDGNKTEVTGAQFIAEIDIE